MNTLQKYTTLLFSLIFRATVFSCGAPAFAQTGSSSASNIIVETVPDSSISFALLDRVKHSWPWYVTRASGLLAGVLLVILMLSGTGFITGGTYRFLEPITAWATHKALGIALTVSVLIHIVALYFDTFVHFDIASLLIPFASDFGSVELLGTSFGSLYVALGIFGFYIFLAVVVTSLVWINSRQATWKVIHIFSYLACLFVFIHGLNIGTDLSQGLPRFFWWFSFVLVTYATFKRLWRVKTV